MRYHDGASLYQYVNSDSICATDPKGLKAIAPTPASQDDPDAKYQPTPKNWQPDPKPYFPAKPNTNKTPPANKVGFTEDGPDTIPNFLGPAAKRFGDGANNRPKSLKDLDTALMAYGLGNGIIQLRLSAHGDNFGMSMGAGRLGLGDKDALSRKNNDKAMNPDNQAAWTSIFNSKRFVCGCEIWLHSCEAALAGIAQIMADTSGCVVYAHFGAVGVDQKAPWGSAAKGKVENK